MPEVSESSELFDTEIRKITFLIIESNGALRRTMTKVLKKAGVNEIIEAEIGKDALVALKTSEKPGVIICAETLPDGSGSKLLIPLAQDKKFENTAILMLFGDSDASELQKAAQAGVDGILIKPFPLTQLKGKVEETIAMRKQKLAMKDARVRLDVKARILIDKKPELARCIELSQRDCQLVFNAKGLGMGDRVQLQLANPAQEKAWFDTIRGSISSTGHHPEGGTQAKIEFLTKPMKTQGISLLIQLNLPKDPVLS